MSISKKLLPFGTSVFSEMSKLARDHGAINLSQGFPDFEGPSFILDAAEQALRSGENQYVRSQGHPRLVKAISDDYRRRFDLSYDPMAEVAVFAGCTEALMSSMMGLLNPGDEVILFEPFYDSYPACVAMAGATARYCPLRFPDFAVDFDCLSALFGPRTRLIVLNTPHNPTGKVFTREELEGIAALCTEHDVTVLTDEVYEHLTYEGVAHIPMATLPGMRDRTLTLSSAGKTFSFTGWKVGWATGPERLVKAAQAAHQFVTFCTPGPFQVAVACGIESGASKYLPEMKAEYSRRREFLLDTLTEAGLKVSRPDGTYFILADFTDLWDGDDVSFARHLTREIRVAAIPPSFFYKTAPEEGRRLVRFAFCKEMATLEAAAARLMDLAQALSRDGAPSRTEEPRSPPANVTIETVKAQMVDDFVGWWRQLYGDTAPLGYHLRAAEKDRWFRIHSLPESKRYAETDSEWAELLRRSNHAATDLLVDGGEIWLLVPRYLFGNERGSDHLELDCLAEPLASIARFRLDESEEADTVQVFGNRLTWRPGEYDELLRAVADDEERALLVSCATGEVVAPYDGGVDFILATSVRRDALRLRFSDWLSKHPQGL